MTITSAKTSINHVPRLIRRYVHCLGSDNLDWGGGKYEATTEYMNKFGNNNHVYDPYNRSNDENMIALNKRVTSITCANVLNVIEKDNDLLNCLKALYTQSASQGGCPIFFSIYEGDKSGTGKTTKKDCYQRNAKVAAYSTFFDVVFPKHEWKREKLDSNCFYFRRYF